MASTRQIKGRIRSVTSNKQITKAMELVAASKLRKAQESAVATATYSALAREILTQLGNLTDVKKTEFFAEKPVKNRLVVLITSDRGLAGAYNANAIKQLIRILSEDAKAKVATKVLCIGRRGAQFVARLKDVEVVGVYQNLPEHITANDIRPILVAAVDEYIDGRVEAVDLVATKYVNSFTQTAVTQPLLPAVFESEAVSSNLAHATFEPSIEVVLEGAVIRLLESQLYQALLDSKASELSMRRVAMKNATDNATELIGDLTLEMNKVRQASITQELSEISAGVEAMN